MLPLISLIVPVYNASSYLRNCMDSLINQTYRNLEIIAINDGSIDESLKVLKDYAQKDSRVRVVDQDNRGHSYCRNIGMTISKGEYLMFVDADDWLDLNTCELTVARAIEGNFDLVMWPYMKEYEDSSSCPVHVWTDECVFRSESEIQWLQSRITGLSNNNINEISFLDSLGTAWGKLYLAERIKEIEFIDIKKIGSAEDVLFNVTALNRIKSVIYITNIHYHYRKNSFSYTRSYRKDLIAQWEHLFDLLQLQNSKGKEELNNRKVLALIGLGLNELNSESNNHFVKLEKISAVLNKEWFVTAIASFPIHSLKAHWRVLFWMAKCQSSFGVYMLLKLLKYLLTVRR